MSRFAIVLTSYLFLQIIDHEYSEEHVHVGESLGAILGESVFVSQLKLQIGAASEHMV